MKPFLPLTLLKDQRGVALPVALIALISLTGLLIVFLGLGSTESLIGESHTDVTDARFVAEGGVEWAYDSMATNPNWNAVLLGPDGLGNTSDDGVLAAAMALPGLPAVDGTFSVTIRNDSQAGDPQITGVAVDPGGPFNDTNNRVIITAVGGIGPTTRTIQVVLRRIDLPPIVAALSLPGIESDTTFNGNAFEVNGGDTNMDDTPGSKSPVWGIAVGDGMIANENAVEKSLSKPQKNNVQGQNGIGDDTISTDPALTSSAIADFIRAVKQRADMTLASTQADPASFTNIGASCGTDPASQTCWGTPSSPKIVYVKGEPDPTSAFSALSVSGDSAGAGILIVEDGDFKISGNFRWDGIVIVTGQWVGVSYMGGGWQTVYGAVISNETATDPGYKEALVSGNAKLSYSSEAIDLARQSRKLLTLTSWREI